MQTITSERMGSMTKLTIDHVAEIMPNARANGLDREWQYFLKTCHDSEIAQGNVKNRLAAFLMNVAKESGELYYVEEIADGWDYEWREDLGNTQQGDGPRYKGHGYIQTTGRLNHRKVGKALAWTSRQTLCFSPRSPIPGTARAGTGGTDLRGGTSTNTRTPATSARRSSGCVEAPTPTGSTTGGGR